MGGKRSGKRQYIHLCIAILIFLIPLGCAFDQMMSTKMVDASGEEARAHLTLGRKFFAEGNFADALKENEKVLSLAGRNMPIDEALLSIALIHTHVANPARDYGKSLVAFRKLINDYPRSFPAQQAKVIMDLIHDVDNFNRRVERLNHIIDELQKAVTGIDAKTAEQAKTILALTHENEKLSHTIEKLNTIIDELKRVDIDVDLRRKRDKAK
jgi:tetratricopeptide (TPR) repeat protein